VRDRGQGLAGCSLAPDPLDHIGGHRWRPAEPGALRALARERLPYALRSQLPLAGGEAREHRHRRLPGRRRRLRCAVEGDAALAFQPERWAAGIDIVGISSLVSFLENTSPWRRYFREREYGSLEHDREFLEQASPLTHVDAIRAPLFIIHGANDPRVPLSEAQQIHRVLTEKNVPCELLVYPDEGHGLQKLANRLDAYPRAAAFLERVLA
jgi:acetyl esterase/lipase